MENAPYRRRVGSDAALVHADLAPDCRDATAQKSVAAGGLGRSIRDQRHVRDPVMVADAT